MYFYCIYDKKIQSDLYFPQLISAEEDIHDIYDITIEAGQIPDELLNKADTKEYEFGEKYSWLSNATCFLIMERGRKIIYHLKRGGNESYLRTYILGWGVSMLALQLGEMAIHCSAVANQKGAVMICGESGSGKSTLTSAFLQNGWDLMADDMTLAEVKEDKRVMIKPAFPYQKLCRDALSQDDLKNDKLIYIDEKKDKYLVPCMDNFRNESVQARAIFILVLSKENEVRITNLQGIQKFHGVTANLFLRNLLGDMKFSPKIGTKCLEIAASIPIYLLERPYGVDTQKQVWEAVCYELNECY